MGRDRRETYLRGFYETAGIVKVFVFAFVFSFLAFLLLFFVLCSCFGFISGFYTHSIELL